MRELTKSMMSFSWAMSLFGLRQVTNMLMPQTMGTAASAFDSVTRSTRDELGDFTRGLFQSGDQLQRAMVDWTLNALSLGGMIPGLDDCGGCGQARSTSAGGRPTSPPAGSGTAPRGTGQEKGWGPMPGGV